MDRKNKALIKNFAISIYEQIVLFVEKSYQHVFDHSLKKI